MSERISWIVRGIVAGTIGLTLGIMGCSQQKPATEEPMKEEVKTPPPPPPAPAPAPVVRPAPAGEQSYTVQKGDTLASIGRKFGVSWKKIQEVNQLANPNMIRPGQKIMIPAGGSAAPKGGGGGMNEPF